MACHRARRGLLEEQPGDFLYGEGKGATAACGESPIRVYRRSDIARVRLTPHDATQLPRVLDVAHVDLYFFYDIDVTILALEIYAENLSLRDVQDPLYRLGRAYPTHWEDDGHGAHCAKLVEWLGPDGRVLAPSDYGELDSFLNFVGANRAPRSASHWDFLFRRWRCTSRSPTRSSTSSSC